jgi:hypothetical protein
VECVRRGLLPLLERSLCPLLLHTSGRKRGSLDVGRLASEGLAHRSREGTSPEWGGGSTESGGGSPESGGARRSRAGAPGKGHHRRSHEAHQADAKHLPFPPLRTRIEERKTKGYVRNQWQIGNYLTQKQLKAGETCFQFCTRSKAAFGQK